jgi:transcription elongation factor Elf1
VARIIHQANKIRTEQLRVLDKTFECVVAGQQHALQVTVDAGVVVERDARFATQCFQAGQPGIKQDLDGAWACSQGHAPILAAGGAMRPAAA